MNTNPSLSAPILTAKTTSTNVRNSDAEKLKAQQMVINAENSFTRILGQLLENRENGNSSSSDLDIGLPDLPSLIGYDTLNQLPLHLNNPVNTLGTPVQSSDQVNLSTTTIQDSSASRIVDNLNQKLGGKLKGMGQVFVNVGKSYGVNPILLASISIHETGNGTSKAAYERNNISGTMTSQGLKNYASVEESILDMARNIKTNYLDKGLHTIQDIGKKYAPIGAENDPTNLNHYWVSQVTQNFNKLSV